MTRHQLHHVSHRHHDHARIVQCHTCGKEYYSQGVHNHERACLKEYREWKDLLQAVTRKKASNGSEKSESQAQNTDFSEEAYKLYLAGQNDQPDIVLKPVAPGNLDTVEPPEPAPEVTTWVRSRTPSPHRALSKVPKKQTSLEATPAPAAPVVSEPAEPTAENTPQTPAIRSTA